MVTRVGEAARQKADTVAGKVFEENAGNRDFTAALRVTLGHDPLNEALEIFLDLRVGESGRCARADLAEHDVALRVVKGIVHTESWYATQPVDVGREVLRIGHVEKIAAVQRIRNVVARLPRLLPVTGAQIANRPGFAFRHAGKRIQRGEVGRLGHQNAPRTNCERAGSISIGAGCHQRDACDSLPAAD